MPLMAKTTVLKSDDEIPNNKKLPCSPKFILQATLFLLCVLIIVYLYYDCSSTTNLKDWTDFSKRINSTTKEFKISEPSKWQPLSGKLFCSVASKQGNEELDQLNILQKSWLQNCDSSQIFTYTELSKTRTLAYRSIFAQLKGIQHLDFWQQIYGFTYSYNEISRQFDWYLNAQPNSYVFVQHLKTRLSRLDHQKPFVFMSQTKNNQFSLAIMSNAAIKLLANKLFLDDELCPFNEKPTEGLKNCFANVGVEIFDEHQLRLNILDYENAKVVDNLEHAPTIFNNLLAITECEFQVLYLIKLLSEERHLSNDLSNTSNCTNV